MTPHAVLIGIAIICELGAALGGFVYPAERAPNLMALGLLFYFISLLM